MRLASSSHLLSSFSWLLSSALRSAPSCKSTQKHRKWEPHKPLIDWFPTSSIFPPLAAHLTAALSPPPPFLSSHLLSLSLLFKMPLTGAPPSPVLSTRTPSLSNRTSWTRSGRVAQVKPVSTVCQVNGFYTPKKKNPKTDSHTPPRSSSALILIPSVVTQEEKNKTGEILPVFKFQKIQDDWNIIKNVKVKALKCA